MIARKCNRMWDALQGTVKLIQMANGWYCLEFTHQQDIDFVLENRPWFIKGRIFHIRRWSPSFNPRTAEIEALILWIRLPNLPLHYWSQQAIQPIVQVVARFIKLDEHTENGENYVFARVCMEIDLRTPLKCILVIRKEEEGDLPFDLVSDPAKIYVSYETIFEVCFECGSYKYKIRSCPFRRKDNHFVMVDKEEGDDDIVSADMDVEPEVRQLATSKVMLYFPQPIKEEELEENDHNNPNVNPSPEWQLIRGRNQNYSLAKGADISANLQKKGKAVMESGGSARQNTRKEALVKPGISFKDATQERGTIIIGDDNLNGTHSPHKLSSSSEEEVFENFSDARASSFAGEDQNMNEYEVKMINGRRALGFATEDSGKESGSKRRTRDMVDDQSMVEVAGNEEDIASSHKAHKP